MIEHLAYPAYILISHVEYIYAYEKNIFIYIKNLGNNLFNGSITQLPKISLTKSCTFSSYYGALG